MKHVILSFKIKRDVISDHFLMLWLQQDPLDTVSWTFSQILPFLWLPKAEQWNRQSIRIRTCCPSQDRVTSTKVSEANRSEKVEDRLSCNTSLSNHIWARSCLFFSADLIVIPLQTILLPFSFFHPKLSKV